MLAPRTQVKLDTPTDEKLFELTSYAQPEVATAAFKELCRRYHDEWVGYGKLIETWRTWEAALNSANRDEPYTFETRDAVRDMGRALVAGLAYPVGKLVYEKAIKDGSAERNSWEDQPEEAALQAWQRGFQVLDPMTCIDAIASAIKYSPRNNDHARHEREYIGTGVRGIADFAALLKGHVALRQRAAAHVQDAFHAQMDSFYYEGHVVSECVRALRKIGLFSDDVVQIFLKTVQFQSTYRGQASPACWIVREAAEGLEAARANTKEVLSALRSAQGFWNGAGYLDVFGVHRDDDADDVAAFLARVEERLEKIK